jgi:hypothetical protein
MRFSTGVNAATLLLCLCSPAFAFGLTDTDYDYLATQNVPRDSAVLKGLSPKEQASLHYIIGDPASQLDPVARAKSVFGAIEVFREHQRWEQEHPGQLWDWPKR